MFSHLLRSPLALAFLFSSVLPTSVLTFKDECGPGCWAQHQRRLPQCSAVTSITSDKLSLLMSAGRVCGEAPRKRQTFSLSSSSSFPACTWGWVSPPLVPLPPASPPSLHTKPPQPHPCCCCRRGCPSFAPEMKPSAIATFRSVNAQQM